MLLRNLVNNIQAQSTYNLAVTNCCLLCSSPARFHHFGSKNISHLQKDVMAGQPGSSCWAAVIFSWFGLYFCLFFLSLHLVSFSSKTSMLSLLFLPGFSFMLQLQTQKQRMAAYLDIWQPKLRKKKHFQSSCYVRVPLFSSNYLKK